MNAVNFKSMEGKQFASQIRPSVAGKSAKYSWRLHLRAKKEGREQVFLAGESEYQVKLELKNRTYKASQLYVGRIYDGYLHGRRIIELCATNIFRFDRDFAIGASNLFEITDWFWPHYIERGRCVIWRDLHEFERVTRNSRRCRHCGHWQYRSIHLNRMNERKEMWK